MMKYLPSNIEIEAVEFNGFDVRGDPLFATCPPQWVLDAYALYDPDEEGYDIPIGSIWINTRYQLYIKDVESSMIVSTGDYIIRTAEGRMFPMKPALFLALYEAA